MFLLSSDMFAVYRRLLGYLRPHKLVVIGAGVAAAIYALADAAVPFLMKEVIERLDDVGRSTANAYQIPLLIAVLFPVRGSMDVLTVYGLGWVGRSVIRDLRQQLFEHYLSLPARFFDESSSGELISKLTYNTEQVAEAISNAVVVFLRDTLAILVLLATMIYLSWQLTLLIGIVGPTVGFLVGYMTGAFRRYSARIQRSMGDVTRITDQSLHGQRVIKIFDGHAHEQRRFGEVNRQNFRLNMRLVATRAAGDALTAYAVALGVAAVIFVAFSDWLLANLNAALFVAFITAMGMILSPLKRLININVALQRGIAAAASLFEIIDEPSEADTGTATIDRARGDVEYRHVTFEYDAAKGPVLKDVSLVVPAGTKVALVGQPGSGKSTLASLLARFYDTQQGAVLLDGQDVRHYRLRDLRRQISLVSQDVVLFDDSIANNIAYGALARRSREEVERAAEAAYVSEFAAELPNGLDTRVGERGAMLSGGQRQRVAIARALLKDAPVLILDEATSALDTESERRVQAALARLMRGRTTLVIAHRLSTIEGADRIVVIRDGAIVETGNHAELVERGGYYSTLHRMQFAG
jgi:ATP-binding cassette, subfamily B, bacterial MsbA